MTKFSYNAPTTLDNAFELMNQFGPDARIMAGGTDLLVRIKTGRVTPSVLIDIKHIEQLNSKIFIDGSNISIGALTLMADLQDDPLVKKYFIALAEAAASVGSVQIRNRATLAGNLCNASPAADTAPALLVYGAKVRLSNRMGSRILPLHEFILGPGKTALAPGELLVAVLVPIPSEPQAAAFCRLTRRKGVDLATINVCCQVLNSGITRFAVGAAGPVPFVVENAKGDLADPNIDLDKKMFILQNVMEAALPISDVRASREYRQAMLAVLARRALETALARLYS